MSNVFPGNFAAAETGVFWDIEECEVPKELNASDIVERIKSNLSNCGHRGTVSIRAYGDLKNHVFPSHVTLNQFPQGERYERHNKMLVDILAWAAEHPQPSNFMLIIGEKKQDDFLDVVELLSEKNYQFLLTRISLITLLQD